MREDEREFAYGLVTAVNAAALAFGAENTGTDESPDFAIRGERAYFGIDNEQELVGIGCEGRVDASSGESINVFDACVAYGLPTVRLTYDECLEHYGDDVMQQLIMTAIGII